METERLIIDAMRWAKEKELINVIDYTWLLPQAPSSRSQFCAVIHRFCIKILKMPSYEDIAHPLDE